MNAALVLSGGGPLAVGWELGVLRGLRDSGVSIDRFERIIGTSAGAITGMLLTTHASIEPIQIQPAGDPAAPRSAMNPELGRHLGRLFAEGGIRDQAIRAELGQLALENAIPEGAYLDARRAVVPEGAWPPALIVTAVDAADGSLVAWDVDSGVPLLDAIAASTALPGAHPPVTIGGRRYVDGGVRSVLSADLASGSRVVVIVAALPVIQPLVADELGRVEAAGGDIVQIRPDAPSMAAFGSDRMDETRQSLVFEAGVRQGAAAAIDVSHALDTLER